MAIASEAPPTNIANAGTSINMGTNPNAVCFLFICLAGSSTFATPTCGGTNMTAFSSAVDLGFGGGAERFGQWFYLVNPATGSQSVVPNQNVSFFDIAKGIALSGVDQANPIDSSNSASGQSGAVLTLSTTVVAANCWLLGGGNGNNAFNAVGGNFDNASKNVVGGFGCYSNATVGTGSQSGTATMTATELSGGIILSVQPVQAGGAVARVNRSLNLLGVSQ